MEAASLVLSAAQTVLTALQCPQLREICAIWHYEPELDGLQKTVSAIESVLLDAEAKPVLSSQEKHFVERLRDVVYDADDFLDKFTTLAEQQHHLIKGGKVSKKVRLLFCHFGKLDVAYKMSKEVKKIRKELDQIASDADKFCFKVNNQPIVRRREDTCSYVYEQSIIGRDEEKAEIINMLLDDLDVKENVSVVTIVGMGGMGKTALAQLVFNDERVKNEFPLRWWVCVADQDGKGLDVQAVLAQILEVATGEKNDGSRLELVQSRLRDQLQGKKYLLVLDDVWTENRNKGLHLVEFLIGGAIGSRIIVTTRSRETARAVGSALP